MSNPHPGSPDKRKRRSRIDDAMTPDEIDEMERLTANIATPPGSPEKGLDEQTEHLIGEYGAACYEVGFQNAEDDQLVAYKARIERENYENALRSRIQTLVSEARREGFQRCVGLVETEEANR